MNIAFRVSAVLACCLLGLAFPVMFLLAALIAWSIYGDLTSHTNSVFKETPSDARPLTVLQMRASCESPAEEAFLDAMVRHFGLQPSQGALEGNGLRLRSQVEISRYRIDFLVDERLVVEVDGATWHSSPEAIARDRARDADLQSRGYKVLRIPAKVTLYDRPEAVARVKVALDALRRDGQVPAGASVATSVVSPRPPELGVSLAGLVRAMDLLSTKAEENWNQSRIDNFLERMLCDVEEIVKAAAETALLMDDIEKRRGLPIDETRIREHFLEAIKRISAHGDSLSLGQPNLTDALPDLRKAMSRDQGRAYCGQAIERAVDEHLRKLSESIAPMFPRQPPSANNVVAKVGHRLTLINQLRYICFDGWDPKVFTELYRPDLQSHMFAVWWNSVSDRGPRLSVSRDPTTG